VLVPAAVTLHEQEAVLQQAALQIVLELLAHELREVTASAFNVLHEARVMLSDNGVEIGLFRPMPEIGRSNRKDGLSRHWV
jgi:hypothetical protein